jgi:imidazole glycerol phosphate synthase subunit HisF
MTDVVLLLLLRCVFSVLQLAKAVEAMGAGEILLNAIDNDGKGQGFDLHLVESVSRAVTIPVIASSGAGSPEHFTEVRNGLWIGVCALRLAASVLLEQQWFGKVYRLC